MKRVRTRFAPSPTGYLHIGGVRGVLFSYFFAKQNNGDFILRIEDTDRSRFVDDAVENIISALKWLGVSIDEGPIYQSKRLDMYKSAADKLISEGKAYRCFCNSERLTEVREQRTKEKKLTSYDRHCRHLSKEEIDQKLANGDPYVVRLAVPEDGITKAKDLLRGEIEFQNNRLEDIVLLKRDGFPTYHLAHVVDDHDMEISHVTRGEEWIPSLPVHWILFNYMGYEHPEYVHLPLVLSEKGGKLSKRHGDVAVNAFREKGYLPEAMVNFTSMLGWAYDDKTELFTMDELIKYFSFDKVKKSAAVFSYDKLKWYNGVYLRKLDDEEYFKRMVPFLIKSGMVKSSDNTFKGVSEGDKEFILSYIPHIKERIELLSEIPEYCEFFYKQPKDYDINLFIDKKRDLETTLQILEKLIPYLKGIEFNHKSLEDAVRQFISDTSTKVRDIFMPLRVVITGKKVSPGVFEIMEVLGGAEVLDRLHNAITFIKENK